MTIVSRSRYWLPLIPLLALLAFVYWLDRQVQQEIAVAANTQRHDPDGIMDNFHATKMDLQGVPRFLLNAKQLRHYPDHDTTELELPRMTMLTQDRPPVHMNGLRGNVSSRGDEVIFHDNVSVVREAVGDQSAMTLSTEYLRVLPNQDWADTDKAVTIVDAHNTVHAIGLEMDNKTRILKLLSQVRSEHHAK
ncbi:MAG: LPS export ABC transporter periplasmic protein LptC [Proteobacteria bacterium]|nr:LPS export ABC transporter periplasmic protein LptC [Pseudomonadota bacterium]